MTSGVSSGRPQSAVLIPVADAEAVVGPWRREHDPVALAGVPAHITLVVPWLPPAEIDDEELDRLAALVDATPAFAFCLRRTGWFGRRVLWLEPDPAEPFAALTATIADEFNTPPWEDEFDEVVPHLTVAHASDGVELSVVAKALELELPLPCRATEVMVMVGDGAGWSGRARLPLGRDVR